MQVENNGGKTNYYDLPGPSVELIEDVIRLNDHLPCELLAKEIHALFPNTINDLIEHKDMRFWRGEIFKASYGLDGRIEKNGGSELRELNKMVYYVNRRLKMLGEPTYVINED
jgi:hypothetical protein